MIRRPTPTHRLFPLVTRAWSRVVWSNKRGRHAFTLIELMIVTVIIGFLTALALGALYRATEAARNRSTQSSITRLHSAIMARWNSYRTRRVQIDAQATALALGLNPNSQIDLATVRLMGLREMMRMEMPQSYDDLYANFAARTPRVPLVPGMPDAALARAYRRRILTSATNANEPAELLYLIVTTSFEDDSISGDNNLSLRDVGDTDKDGMSEFLDAWGRPIMFLRWAPGFVSEIQPDLIPLTAYPDRDNINDHDPFDPSKVDPPAGSPNPDRGFRLTPLIYSGGPDREYDINAALPTGSATGVLNDPYYIPSLPSLPLGTPYDFDGTGLSHFDNLTNHAQEAR